MATLQRFIVNIGGKRRREQLEGRWHTVVPIAMLPRHGVVPGSRGPVLYPESENRAAVPSWNHKPMVVNHPKDEDGNNISGALPHVLNERKIGLILNTSLGDKLMTEGWFDEERTRAVDKRIMERIEKDESIEASTGLVVDLEEEDGEWEGEAYKYRAVNHHPDHLAILPDKLGAYPVSKGGGVMAANEAMQPDSVREVLRRSAERMSLQNRLCQKVGNELSYSDVSCRLADLLREKYGKPGHYWHGSIEAVYDNRVVFSDGHDYSQMKMIGYKVGQDDAVSLYGDATPVERVVEYRAASGESYAVNAAGELVLDEETVMPLDKKARIAELVKAGVVKQADADKLEKLPEDALSLFGAPAGVQPAETTTETNEDDGDEVLQKPARKSAKKEAEPVANDGDKKKATSLADFVANLDDDGKAEFAAIKRAADAHVRAEQREKVGLVKEILACNANKFSEKYLQKRELPELRGLAQFARTIAEKEEIVNERDDQTFALASGGFSEDDLIANEPDEQVDEKSIMLPSPRMNFN